MVLPSEAPPTVYISYHGDATLGDWAEALATRLRQDSGVDATVDRWLLAPGDQIPQSIESAIGDNEFVVLVCTPEYARLFDTRSGEVGYAAAVITGRVLRQDERRKYIPIWRDGRRDEAVPTSLRDYPLIDLRGDPYDPREYQFLVQTLHRARFLASGAAIHDLIPLRTWEHLSWSDLVRRSSHAVRFTRDSLRERLRILPPQLDPHGSVESGLEHAWREFVRKKTWKQVCLDQAGILIERLGEFSDFAAARTASHEVEILAARLRKPDAYVSLRAAFDPRLTSTLFTALQQLRLEAPASARSREERTSIDRAVAVIQRRGSDLIATGSRAVFRKCFLVMGGVGSGKSHVLCDTLSELADAAGDGGAFTADCLPIWVDRPSRAVPLTDHLLRAVRFTTLVEWPNLEVFSEFVMTRRADAKVVAVIDDLHRWVDADPAVKEELPKAVESLTRLDVLHWLIVMNDRAYADIAPLTERLWAVYCDAERNQFSGDESGVIGNPALPVVPRSGGWYRLDELDEEQELGFEIVRRSVARMAGGAFGTSPGLDDATSHGAVSSRTYAQLAIESAATTTDSRRALSNPLIASVLIASAAESRLDLPGLFDVRFVEFIRQLRTLLIERSLQDSTAGGVDRVTLEQSVDYVARVFVAAGHPEQPTVRLRGRIAELAAGLSPLSEAGTLSLALRSLERAHLVETFERQDPEGITPVIQWTGLRFDLFWELHLAQQQLAIARTRHLPATAIVQWLASFDTSRFKSGVAQFLLLLSEANGDAVAGPLWDAALVSGGPLLHSALFAATHATLARQDDVASRLLRGVLHPASADDLMALVAFARLASDSAATPAQRVALLHPHFLKLGRSGLGDYASFTLAYAIRGMSQAEVQDVLASLEGAEMLGPAVDDLARLCIDRLTTLYDGDSDRLSRALLTFARRRREPSTRAYEQEQRKLRTARTKGGDRFLFRHWLFDHASHRIAANQLEHAYEFFWTRKWYTAKQLQVEFDVSTELEKFANFSISDFARNDEHRRDRLVVLVNRLVESGDRRHRHNAFYLIRHSELIDMPGVPVIVDARFHDALKTIVQDPKLAYLRQRLPEFVAANLRDLDERPLRAARRRHGRGWPRRRTR